MCRTYRISTVSVSRIKKRYLLKGDGAFIHGHTGKPSHNRKFSAKDKKYIVGLYKKYFPYAPYEIFLETLKSDFKINVSYTSIYTMLDGAGMMSPSSQTNKRKEKTFTAPRTPARRRTCAAGRVQAWLVYERPLYLYTWRQTYELTGGFPEAAYTDRSEIFFVTKESLNKITIEEQLQGYEKRQTQWQILRCRTCRTSARYNFGFYADSWKRVDPAVFLPRRAF